MAQIQEIGIVHSKFREPTDPFTMRKEISRIEVFNQYAEGLYDIESNRFLQILFHFHKSESFRLLGSWYYGDKKGVFACRSPKRPGAVGLTTVELIKREGNILTVSGLDALDGTPVLDIKPFSSGTDMPDRKKADIEFTFAYPRAEVIKMVKTSELERLLALAGVLHGHYCPGLALGVAASVHGLAALARARGIEISKLLVSEGMEELISIIEINSCFADGVQFVSGCTFGNNALVYKDLGKNAVTFALRSGSGVRVVQKPEVPQLIMDLDSCYTELFTEVVVKHNRDPERLKAFKQSSRKVSSAVLGLPAEKLFTIREDKPVLPDYAPIWSSLVCVACGEQIAGGKAAVVEPPVCRTCADNSYGMIDGRGIHIKE